jgi:hypothetical protein
MSLFLQKPPKSTKILVLLDADVVHMALPTGSLEASVPTYPLTGVAYALLPKFQVPRRRGSQFGICAASVREEQIAAWDDCLSVVLCWRESRTDYLATVNST